MCSIIFIEWKNVRMNSGVFGSSQGVYQRQALCLCHHLFGNQVALGKSLWGFHLLAVHEPLPQAGQASFRASFRAGFKKGTWPLLSPCGGCSLSSVIVLGPAGSRVSLHPPSLRELLSPQVLLGKVTSHRLLLSPLPDQTVGLGSCSALFLLLGALPISHRTLSPAMQWKAFTVSVLPCLLFQLRSPDCWDAKPNLRGPKQISCLSTKPDPFFHHILRYVLYLTDDRSQLLGSLLYSFLLHLLQSWHIRSGYCLAMALDSILGFGGEQCLPGSSFPLPLPKVLDVSPSKLWSQRATRNN